jgi:single-stranded DNA-binding protein
MKLQKQNHTLYGQIEFDVELRYVPSGKGVASFTVIGAADTITRCEAWGELAEEIAWKYTRHMEVKMIGSYRTKRWTDIDGNDREYDYFAISKISPISMVNREEKRSYE